MCGIVGYIGKKSSISGVVSELAKLEYRGYDSAGVAYVNQNKICAIKKVGHIQNLKKCITNQSSKICISHTRWATHGKVSEQNAHPIISYQGNYAVVHNGIIENYLQLKSEVGEDKFSTSTDTEVIANLMEVLPGSTYQKFMLCTQKLVGSYAIALFDKHGKNLYVAKNKSPLYVAKSASGFLVASDISCLPSGNYYFLPDNVAAVISKTTIEFYMGDQKINLKPSINTYDFGKTELVGFSHYMQKEIEETSSTIDNIILRYKSIHEHMLDSCIFSSSKKIILTGCGTAYHACLLGASWIRKNFGVDAKAELASELRYSNINLDNSLVILVSQSGETADTLAVGELAKECGAKIIAITNVEYSTITTLADITLPLCAGKEIAVASTKAYSAMLCVLFILANKNSSYNYISSRLSQLKSCLMPKLDGEIVNLVSKSKRVFFIGRQDDGVTALEGALKLKEIAYLDASGYYAGELKHGTIALIEPGVIVVAIITDTTLESKTLSAVEEVTSRGAKVILVTDNFNISGNFTKILVNKPSAPELKSVAAIVPLQRLAYLVSTKLGYNPDKPRNLAKSVTVE